MLGLKTSFGIFPRKTLAESTVDAAIDLQSGIAGAVTFTRATSAYDPYFNKIIPPGTRRRRPASIGRYRAFALDLIEGPATNLLAAGSSETWTGNSPQGATQGSNTTVYSPDPTQLMNLLVESAATSPHYLFQSFSITGTVASYQIVLKPYGGLQYVMIREGSQTGDAACYDLVNGVVNSTASCTATCTALAGGLFRLTISISNCATGTLHFDTATLQSATTNWTTASYAGNTSMGFYWWGQMAEANANPTSYVSNRNLLLHSQNYSTTWALSNLTATAAAAANPLNGAMDAFALADTATSGQHLIGQGITISAGTWTYSFYVKQGTYTGSIQAYFNASGQTAQCNINTATGAISTAFGGVYVSSSSANAGNGWWRISLTANPTNTGLTVQLYFNNGATYSGTGQTIYLYGCQVEPGSSATAYWGTDTAPGVRDADNLSVSLASLPGGGLSTTSGTLLGLMIPYGWTGATGVGKRLFDDGSVDANVGMLVQGSNGIPQFYRADSGGGHNCSAISAVGSGLTCVGGTYSASNITIYQNGVVGAVAYPITQPYTSSTSLAIGTVTGGGGTTQLDGWVALLYWHNRVLSTSENLALTGAAHS